MNITNESMTPNFFDLSNVIFYERKKTRSLRDDQLITDNIYFSINRVVYKIITFYIGIQLLKKARIDTNTRLAFGYNKYNRTEWYLISNKDGYRVRDKSKDNSNYYVTTIFPFEFINKKMQLVTRDNIEINSDQRVIKFSTADIFKKTDLVTNWNNV